MIRWPARKRSYPKLARVQRVLSVTELNPGEFVGRLDQMIAVYAAAMRPPAEMLPGRRSIMAGHAAHPGFRALLATEDGSGADKPGSGTASTARRASGGTTRWPAR